MAEERDNDLLTMIISKPTNRPPMPLFMEFLTQLPAVLLALLVFALFMAVRAAIPLDQVIREQPGLE